MLTHLVNALMPPNCTLKKEKSDKYVMCQVYHTAFSKGKQNEKQTGCLHRKAGFLESGCHHLHMSGTNVRSRGTAACIPWSPLSTMGKHLSAASGSAVPDPPSASTAPPRGQVEPAICLLGTIPAPRPRQVLRKECLNLSDGR